MRTDLAKESRAHCPDCDGITEEIEHVDQMEITRITVNTKEAAEALDKPVGTYVSVFGCSEAFSDADSRHTIAARVSDEIKRVTGRIESALVIGLGNRYVTADALGTKTAEYVLVTRHVHLHLKELLPEGTPVTTSFCANVFGVTGLETSEVVSAITDKIQPGLVILVDSLAANSVEHIGRVIQFNDSGIAPGAGVGNFRTMLTRDTLHVPVLAIGIPTVVSAKTIATAYAGNSLPSGKTADMIVTPKDIDALVRDLSRVLSEAINRTLFGDNYTELEKILH
jgi:spore protease